MRPRTRWLNLALLVALAAAVWLAVQAVGGPQAPPPEVRTVAVARGSVTATVTGSGNAESALSTPVNFATSGTVTAIDVQPGDTVEIGQVLARIDDGSARAALRTAQAQYDNAAAALAQAEAGPTEVRRQQDELAITQAQQALDNARVSVGAAEAQLGLDDESTRTAIENAESTLDNDRESTGQAVADAKAKLSTDTTAQNALVSAAEADERSACSGSADDDGTSTGTSCTSAKQATTNAKNTRTSTLQAGRQAVTTAEQTRESTLDASEQAVTTAEQTRETTLLADENAITTAKQSVTTAEGNLTSAQLTAQANLNPQTPEQIAQARANVDSAQVSVDTAQADLAGTVLVAPQDGVVLAVSGKVGLSSSSSGSGAGAASAAGSGGGATGGGSGGSGTAASTASAAASSAGEGFVVIANLSALAVTANIPEADAATIQLGQSATVSFPGTGTTATGRVTRVHPQSTVLNNVVLYPVTVSLDTAPPAVGVGSTAELAITTGTARGVLKVPTQAVTTTGSRHTVTVLRDGVETVVPVRIGVSGTTDTEITSGVAEGDQLVLPGVSTTAGPG